MRVLTVRQPWAWAIIHAGKDVENRWRNFAGDYRGPLAIHAGLADFEQHNMASEAHKAAQGSQTPTRMIFGAIIGVVDLVDVHEARATASGTLVDWAAHTTPGKLCSAWGEWEQHHLVLDAPRALRTPIPFKGSLAMRTLDAATEAQVLQQVSG